MRGLRLAALCASLAAGAFGCGDDAAPDDHGGLEDGGGRDGGGSAGGGGGREDAGAQDAGEQLDASDSGGDPDAGDAGDAALPSTPLPAYCSDAASGYFAWLQGCFGQESYPDAMRDSFVEQLRSRCMHAERAVTEGRLRYDGERAASCLQAAEAADCIGTFFETEACSQVFAGLVPLGEDCYPEESQVFLVGVESCSEGYCEQAGGCPGECRAYVEREQSCESGRCAPEDFCHPTSALCVERAGSGESCGETECELDLTCFGDDDPRCVASVSDEDEACDDAQPCAGLGVCIDGRCRWRAGEGEPCKASLQCPEGLSCESELAGSGRICMAPGGAGASCTVATHCAEPLVCVVAEDETVGECADDPAVLDQPCDDGRCAAGLWCSYVDEPVAGLCRMRVGENENCMVSGLPDTRACAEGLHCTEAGTCAPPGEEGDPCNAFELDSCTAGLWCSRETGLCTTPAAEDGACNPFWPDTCQAGLGCACGQLDRDLCGSYPREQLPTDTCQPRVADGESCYRQAECESLECQFDFEAPSSMAGQCVSPPAACLP